MLVLTRTKGEAVVLSGPGTVRILRVKGNEVRVGIEAEDSTRIMREEVADREEVQGRREKP